MAGLQAVRSGIASLVLLTCMTSVFGLGDPADGSCIGADKCIAGFGCPAGKNNTCVCTTFVGNNGITCYNPASGVSCPGGSIRGLVDYSGNATAAARNNAGGICIASSSGDPLVEGFDGCSWYMKGQPDQVLNMVSESAHCLNTQLVAANLIDPDHSDPGTFHGALSVRYGKAIVFARVTPQGNLTVLFGETVVPFEEGHEESGLAVKVFQFLPFYGQAAEVTTPIFSIFIHAVQPEDTPAGWSRGHLDFATTIRAPHVELHGLLGQSLKYNHDTCPVDWSFQGDGTEVDYLMGDLSKVDFKYSLFGQQENHVTRRLHLADERCSSGHFQPVTAFSGGFN